jgi:hypothetical protein
MSVEIVKRLLVRKDWLVDRPMRMPCLKRRSAMDGGEGLCGRSDGDVPGVEVKWVYG